MNVHNREDEEQLADADLVLRTRSGDSAAFGELWRRHYPSGIAVARSITSSLDPDDLVQESYTRIYNAILKGGGPNGSFRAYLFTSIRNTAAGWGKARRETPYEAMETVVDPDSTDQAANDALDRSLTAQAFRSLPSRWQEVLWYSEIEQMKPAEIAPLLGMKAGAVAQLSFRAREGLREAWIQAHLKNAAPGSDCQWTIEHLGAYSRGNLGARDLKRLDQHLEECARCMIVAAEAKDVSHRLALVLLPLVLGVGGTAGYLATLQGGGQPIIALAAMPSSVIEGAVVVGGPGAAFGAAGAGNAGGAAGGGGAATGGALTGIGALVGAGSAALIVAGVVTAAAVLPGLVGEPAMTSLPSASDLAETPSIPAEVGPDDTLDQPVFVLDVPLEEPEDLPPVVDPPAEDAPLPPDDGGAATPGGDPAPPEPEPVDPEPTDPEPTDPEEGGGEQPVEPALPTAPVTVSEFSMCLGDEEPLPVTYVSIRIIGLPGAVVQASIGGSTARADRVTLDAVGAGTVSIRPSLAQILLGADVSLVYETVTGPAHPYETTLEDLGVTLRSVLDAPTCVIEEPPVEGPPVDEPPVEQPPAETPVDEPAETPVDEPAESGPVDEPAETGPEDVPPADAPAEAPASDEAPAEIPATDAVRESPAAALTPAPAPTEAEEQGARTTDEGVIPAE